MATQSFIGMVICLENFGGIYDESVKIIGTLHLRVACTKYDGKELRLQKKLINSFKPTEIMIFGKLFW